MKSGTLLSIYSEKCRLEVQACLRSAVDGQYLLHHCQCTPLQVCLYLNARLSGDPKQLLHVYMFTCATFTLLCAFLLFTMKVQVTPNISPSADNQAQVTHNQVHSQVKAIKHMSAPYAFYFAFWLTGEIVIYTYTCLPQTLEVLKDLHKHKLSPQSVFEVSTSQIVTGLLAHTSRGKWQLSRRCSSSSMASLRWAPPRRSAWKLIQLWRQHRSKGHWRVSATCRCVHILNPG